MYFFLLQIVLLNLVKSEFFIPWDHVTNDTTSQETGRIKRSPMDFMASQLKFKIRYEHGEEISMNFFKANSFVANENLPVIVPLAHKESNVMDNVGEFIAYYDTQHCASIVYFQKSNFFYGVIGVDYYIQNLPFDFDSRGNHRLQVIGEPYLKKRTNNFLSPLSYTTSGENSHPFFELGNMHDNYNNNTDTPDYLNSGNIENEFFYTYFCEILVFVARDIVDHFLYHFGVNDYIEWIVKYYIIYFHAVDMMFKAIFLPTRTIEVNIAKICIEDNSTPFSFLNNGPIQFHTITTDLPTYFSTFSEYYPEDSFDYVFVHTSRAIWDGQIQKYEITKPSDDLMRAREYNRFYYAVPITIMRYETFHGDYLTTICAMGGIFNININLVDRGLTAIGQSYSVMQRINPQHNYHLQWSEASKNQFTLFLRTNTNRCFLLNQPRSLKKPGPARLQTPITQCKCYGYDNYKTSVRGRYLYEITAQECRNYLICQNIVNNSIVTVNTKMRPFDGTSCGNKKVCWNKKCTN